MGPEYLEGLCLGPQVVKNPPFVLALGLLKIVILFFFFQTPLIISL